VEEELLSKWMEQANQCMERMERSLATLSERKPEVPEYLTSAEAAAYIRVHVKTLQEWVRLGVFPHIPLPGPGRTTATQGR
jgi:hypothetical protein